MHGADSSFDGNIVSRSRSGRVEACVERMIFDRRRYCLSRFTVRLQPWV